MTDQPADLLRAAAAKLRKLAAAATQSPWRKHDADYPHLVIQAPADVPASECDGMISTNLTPNEDADAAYIAAMHPTVGTLLADWLDQAAHHYECGIRAADDVFHDDPAGHEAFLTTGPGAPSTHALAVARAVLGIPEQP